MSRSTSLTTSARPDFRALTEPSSTAGFVPAAKPGHEANGGSWKPVLGEVPVYLPLD